MGFFFWGVFAFIALDVAFLRRRSLEISQQAFSCSPVRTAIFCSLLVLLIFTGVPVNSPERYLSFMLTIFMTCLYITGRRRFKFLLRVSGPETISPKIILFSEVLEVFLLFSVLGLGGELLYELSARVYPPLKTAVIQDLVFYAYLSALVLALIFRLSRQQQVLSAEALTGLTTRGLTKWKLYTLPVLMGVAWAGACAFILMAHPEDNSTPFSKMVSSIDSPVAMLFFIAGAVLLAPFFEEIIFRGFLFAIINRLKGPIPAFIIAAALFALMHVDQYWGDPAAIVMVTVLSVMLTSLRLWTGSTVPGMAMHFSFNTGMTIIPVLIAVVGNPYVQYQIQYKQLDPAKREELLLKSIHKDPKFAPAYNDLAWDYAEAGRNLNQALNLADKAIALEPDNAAFKDTRAEVFFKMGKVDEAIAIETDIVAHHPNQPLLNDQLQKFKNAQSPAPKP